MGRYVRKVEDGLTNLEVYNMLRSGKIKKVPNGFWTRESSIEILRQVCLVENKFTRQDIISKIDNKFIYENGLRTCKRRFNESISEYVIAAFKELDIKQWEMQKVSDTFWKQEENRKNFIIWVFEKEKVDINDPSSISKISAKLLQGKYSGGKAIQFSGGMFQLISLITKDMYMEWEIYKVNKWTDEKAMIAMKWLVTKLGLSDEQDIRNIMIETFYKYNLGGMLSKHFEHSRKGAIDMYLNNI